MTSIDSSIGLPFKSVLVRFSGELSGVLSSFLSCSSKALGNWEHHTLDTTLWAFHGFHVATSTITQTPKGFHGAAPSDREADKKLADLNLWSAARGAQCDFLLQEERVTSRDLVDRIGRKDGPDDTDEKEMPIKLNSTSKALVPSSFLLLLVRPLLLVAMHLFLVALFLLIHGEFLTQKN